MSLSTVTIALALASVVRSHAACNGFDREKERALAESRRQTLFTRQVPDEASQAAINGSAAECTSYNWGPSNAVQGDYPAPWVPATIVWNDTQAHTLFQTINASLNAALPNVLPKGTPDNSAADSSSYPKSDPDCWWTYSQCTTPASSSGLKADTISVPEPDTWGYTFDDGPLCDHNEFYDYLALNNQKASMFYIGSNVQAYPLQAQRAIADGHHVCVHTWSHHYTTGLSNEEVFAELYYARQIIKEVLGVTTKCWRPPYGDIDNRVRFIANALNLTSIVWDQDTSDWDLDGNPNALTTVDSNYASFVSMGKSGQYSTSGPIVLSHELTDMTVQEAMKWYPQIRSAYKHIVPIATAYNWTHPYVELNYTYPDFATYITGMTKTNVSAVVVSATSSSTTGPSRTSMAGNTGSSSASATPSTDVKAVSGARDVVGVPAIWAVVAAVGGAIGLGA